MPEFALVEKPVRPILRDGRAYCGLPGCTLVAFHGGDCWDPDAEADAEEAEPCECGADARHLHHPLCSQSSPWDYDPERGDR